MDGCYRVSQQPPIVQTTVPISGKQVLENQELKSRQIKPEEVKEQSSIWKTMKIALSIIPIIGMFFREDPLRVEECGLALFNDEDLYEPFGDSHIVFFVNPSPRGSYPSDGIIEGNVPGETKTDSDQPKVKLGIEQSFWENILNLIGYGYNKPTTQAALTESHIRGRDMFTRRGG